MPISIQATLKIMQQVKGMGGVITDVIVSDKTGRALQQFTCHTRTHVLYPSLLSSLT